ncbi:ABC transporter substrate-binding protein [Streptomyces lydicus]|nr:ABC transporter substrate-binding protein [Streptomyces lydicus]
MGTLITPSSRRQFLTLLGLSAVAVSCGSGGGGAAKDQTKTLRYQGWAGTVILPELAEELGFLEDVKLKWVGNTISGPQDIQSAATGQVDFGGAFNGAVVKLAARKAPITSVISYYGVDKAAYNGFYVLKDGPVHSARDLIGKKVGMNTLGAHSEAMLDIYLQRHGLSRADIKKVEPLVVPRSTPSSRCGRSRSRWASSATSCGTRPCRPEVSGRCSPTTNCSATSPPAPMW